MPELPEVETVKNVLKELTLNKTIKNVEVLRAQTIEGNSKEFINNLQNETIIDFERIGKFIIFHLTNEKVIISHLRMEGKYFLKEESAPLTKHDLVVFHFNDKTKLIYNDTRRFGKMSFSTLANYKKVNPLKNVGPDPFMMKDSKLLQEAFKNKTIAIKTALLDQSIMSGLGNIYVDEVLFACKIHPETPAKLVNKKQLELILEQSKIVLFNAIKAGGSTIKSYHPREGISGNFQVNLKVYGKKDSTCPNCGTKLRKIFVNGRGTTYCPKCQKNPAVAKLVAITGAIGAGKSTVANIISKKGYTHLDCDQIVHDLYKNKDMQKEIKKIIPELKIKNSDIDRVWLKDYLIANQNKKKRLEKLVHKEVINVVEKELKNSKKPIILEAAFLFETELALIADETIYVDISKAKQIENLKTRNENIEKSLKLNANYNVKNIKKATHIIINDKDVANLEKQIDSIFGK